MSGRALTFLVWALLAISTVVMVSLAAAGRAGIARPAALLRAYVASRTVRIALLLGWMWLGWHFFAR